MNTEEWKKFLMQYGLKREGEPETTSLTSGLQTGGVYEDSLDNTKDRRELGERGIDMPYHRDMHLIRIGKIPEGGKLIAGQKEINLCLEPLFLAKDTLNKEISQLMMSYELDHEEDVKVVKNWVLMKEPTKPAEVPNSDAVPNPSHTPTCAEISKDDNVSDDEDDAGGKRSNLGSTGFSPRKKKQDTGKDADEDDVDNVEDVSLGKRFNLGPTGASPSKKKTSNKKQASGEDDQFQLDDSVLQKFPMMAKFSKTDNVALMDAEQSETLLKEIEEACERIHRDDLPEDLVKMFPTLAKYFPEGLVTGSRVTQAGSSVLDKDDMITNAVVRELFNLRNMQNRPLRVEREEAAA